jgi:hypothetical protein
VLVTEHVPRSQLATANGWLLGSSYVGYFLVADMGALMAHVLDPDALECLKRGPRCRELEAIEREKRDELAAISADLRRPRGRAI